MKLFLTLMLLWATGAAHGVELCAKAIAAIKADKSLWGQVEGLEETKAAHADRFAALDAQIKKTEIAVGILEAEMGFRERYLCGRLGGDRELCRKIARRGKMTEKRQQFLEAHRAAYHQVKSKMFDVFANWLWTRDAGFKAIYQQRDKLYGVLCSARSCLSEISSAASSLSYAGTMEMMDAFSNNQALSAVSYLATSSASSDLSGVKSAVASLNQRLAGLHEEVGGSESDVGDGLDFMFDALGVTDTFDFTSWLNWSSISSAESELSELRRKVERVESALAAEFNRVDANFDEYVRKAMEFRP